MFEKKRRKVLRKNFYLPNGKNLATTQLPYYSFIAELKSALVDKSCLCEISIAITRKRMVI